MPMFTNVLLLFLALLFLLLAAFLLGVETSKDASSLWRGLKLSSSQLQGWWHPKREDEMFDKSSVCTCLQNCIHPSMEMVKGHCLHCSIAVSIRWKVPRTNRTMLCEADLTMLCRCWKVDQRQKEHWSRNKKLVSNALVRDHSAWECLSTYHLQVQAQQARKLSLLSFSMASMAAFLSQWTEAPRYDFCRLQRFNENSGG